MDMEFSPEDLAFQQEVRGWLKENLTPEIMGESKVARNAYMPRERLLDWQSLGLRGLQLDLKGGALSRLKLVSWPLNGPALIRDIHRKDDPDRT